VIDASGINHEPTSSTKQYKQHQETVREGRPVSHPSLTCRPSAPGWPLKLQAIKLVDLPVQIDDFDSIGCARMCDASA